MPTEDECVRTSDPAARGSENGKGYTAALMLSPVGKGPGRALAFPDSPTPAPAADGDAAAAETEGKDGAAEESKEAAAGEGKEAEAEATPAAAAAAATPTRAKVNRAARSGEFLRRGSWGGVVPGLAMVLGGREGGRTKVRVTEAEAPTPGSPDEQWVCSMHPLLRQCQPCPEAAGGAASSTVVADFVAAASIAAGPVIHAPAAGATAPAGAQPRPPKRSRSEPSDSKHTRMKRRGAIGAG